MLATEGVFGLWRGLGPTVLRDVPFSGIYWAAYESLKLHNNVTLPTFWFTFCGGAISGSVSLSWNFFCYLHLILFPFLLKKTFLQIAAFVTAPFDVVKTHRQIEFGEKVLYAEKPVRSLPKVGTFAILSKIFRENGMRGIFAGVVPRVVKVAPACAIMITSFEYSKAFFFKNNVEKFLALKADIH